jgi:hypothetical protein
MTMTVMRGKKSFRIEQDDLEKLKEFAVEGQLDLADILRSACLEDGECE